MAKLIFILACAAAFFAPFVLSNAANSERPGRELGEFPSEFEGRRLQPLGLTERERYFLNDFPGRIERFSDGRREIIIRKVTEATRKLHPASDCFRAIGYTVTPLPLRSDEYGKRWSTFSATRHGETLVVRERIEDNTGREWTDVSAWYWSAWGQETGEWWAWTLAERD